MRDIETPSFLKLLGHDIRWGLVNALAQSDRQVHELVDLVDQPTNLVSYHLRRLRGGDLVKERRSAADGRDVYYHLDLEQLRTVFLTTGESLHPGILLTGKETSSAPDGRRLPRPARVLFLCTHNSARSQMAEAILRHLGRDRVEVESAGTVATRVHPLAAQVMSERSLDLSGHRSKLLDEFLAEHFDYVISVCDNARETCPVFPGAPERIHWSIPDPSAVEGPEEVRLQAFRSAADDLLTRIRFLLAIIERRQGH